MQWIHFSDLGEDPRSAMQGHRWLVMNAEDVPLATAALAFSELGCLGGRRHRGVEVEHGLWMRAVHLMLVNDAEQAEALRSSSGITVIASASPLNLTFGSGSGGTRTLDQLRVREVS